MDVVDPIYVIPVATGSKMGEELEELEQRPAEESPLMGRRDGAKVPRIVPAAVRIQLAAQQRVYLPVIFLLCF